METPLPPILNDNGSEKMKSLTNILIIIFVIGSHSFYAKSILQRVRVIGNDVDEKYTFFDIRGGVCTAKKQIVLLDMKGRSVSKFDIDGNFIKKYASTGQGPMDFQSPIMLFYIKNSLYIYDMGNMAIKIFDEDLKFINTIKVNDNYLSIYLDQDLNVYGSRMRVEPNRGRLVKINSIDQSKKEMILELPETRKNVIMNNVNMMTRIGAYSIVKGTEFGNDNVLFYYQFPDNPITFIKYNIKNEKIEKIIFRLDEEYNFPTESILSVKESTVTYRIDSLLVHKNKIILLMKKTILVNKIWNNLDTILFILQSDGKVLHKESFKEDFLFFSISQDGYIIARDVNDENGKVYLCKLNFSDI